MAAIEEREIPMPSRGENGKASIIISIPHDVSFKAEPTDESTYPFTLPPIILLHGSFHGAWCWDEHYIPYFAQLGYPVVALNFRGAGDNDATPTNRKITIQEHCEDLHCFLQQIPSLFIESETTSEVHAPPSEQASIAPIVKPILISHSFGGIVLMKYLEGDWKTKRQKTLSVLSLQCAPCRPVE
ncbi:unnamed protein product [Cylindrotheca closterium]|uniref:AB hydrolase-1 domain-containing protein n=1 Tax=Cylindrotheca closterium TaxID=2856 RepID=A0AAD2FRJ1_9STRA|nr:unnamed protein product [Cylindrotheca closterium]